MRNASRSPRPARGERVRVRGRWLRAMRFPSPWPSPRTWGEGTRVAALLIALFITPLLFADSEQNRRNEAGIRLFGTLLAADVDLAKKATPDGKLVLLIYYSNDARAAETLAKSLRVMPSGEPRKLAGLPVDVVITTDATFAGQNPAGIFLAQAPPAPTLKSIIQFGIAKRILIYSPYEGHVERGVAGGLSVGAQVKPYVNASTLAASQISLKPLVMKFVKVYQ